MACSLLDNRDLNLPAAGRYSDVCLPLSADRPARIRSGGLAPS